MDNNTTPVAPEQVAQQEAAPAAVKVYPTSFISVKGPMEPSRVPKAQLSGFQIEVIHVAIFFILTIFLFISMWKKPNVRN